MKKIGISILLLWAATCLAQFGGSIFLSNAPVQFLGENAGDLAGYHISIAGDVNADGLADLLIAAPFHDLHEKSPDNGAVYLIFGKKEGWNRTVSLRDADVIFSGEEAGHRASHDVFGLGDVNNDGIDDLGIGVKFNTQPALRAGKVYIIFGKKSGWTSMQSLANADASFLGETETAEAAHVYPVGDVNGDGIKDLVIGAGFDDSAGTDAGKTYVVFGRATAQWRKNVSMAEADASFLGEQTGDFAGHRVAGLGDINGDGLGDFIIGANARDIDEIKDRGICYVILGKKTGWAKNVSLSEAPISFIGPELRNAGIGFNITGPGDVNGDGLNDILIGGQVKSLVYLLLGQKAPWGKQVQVDKVAATTFTGEDPWDGAGYDMRSAGDLNKDGKKDFIIGAPFNNTAGADAGKAYLFHGRGNWQKEIPLLNADAVFIGENPGDQAGFSVAGGGDVNGDGLPDLIIAANANDAGATDAGKVYLLFTQTSDFAVTIPNGGETWEIGKQYVVRWFSKTPQGDVKIELSRDNGQTWEFNKQTADDGAAYFIPEAPSSPHCLMRITQINTGVSDVSDAMFRIGLEDLKLTRPNGGEKWLHGQTHNITWISQGNIPRVSLWYSLDNGQSWNNIAKNLSNSGLYPWPIPTASSQTCLVKVTADNNNFVLDQSDAVFELQTPRVQVIAPNGSEKYRIGQSIPIQWLTEHSTTQVDVELSRDLGKSWETIAAGIPNNGAFGWTATGPASDSCLVKITDGLSNADRSDQPFRIMANPVLQITHPAGGERIIIDEILTIQWLSQHASDKVTLEISRTNKNSWTIIESDVPNSGAFSWKTTAPAADSCWIRISEASGVSDVSDKPFSILSRPSLTLTKPNGGEKYRIDRTMAIEWSSQNVSGPLALEISRDNRKTWQNIITGLGNSGAASWRVAPPAADSCWLRLSDELGNSDICDLPFSIVESPVLQISSPNGGEILEIGETYPIQWLAAHISAPLTIELSRDAGKTWTLLQQGSELPNPWNWKVTEAASDSCLLRMSTGDTLTDVSDGVFAIRYKTRVDETLPIVPQQFGLAQNYPNPFNPTTMISFQLPVAQETRLEIFDRTGRRIKTLLNATISAGIHHAQWDGTDDSGSKAASGAYLCRITTPSYQNQILMLLVK